MPAVPYNGVGDTTLQQNATPNLSLNTPGAAFGENVAVATQGLGKAIEGSGDELFKRGLAMQELYNHSEANQATADYMEKAANLHEDFKSRQGKDAVDAYPGFVKSLKNLRVDMQDGLSNDMSRKLFETSSLSTMGRTIFSAADYSGAQNKKYAIGSSEARIQAVTSAVAQQPKDEEVFKNGLEVAKQEVIQQATLEGMSQDKTYVDNAVRRKQGDLWYNRIESFARGTEPATAQKLLDIAIEKGMIDGEKLTKLSGIVQSNMRQTGARTISSTVRSGSDLSWGSSIIPIGRAKIGITGSENDGNINYDAQGPEVISRETGESRGRALGRYQVMPENLPAWLKESGLPSMTSQEFLKSPQAQEKVFETVFGRYMQETGSFNDAASKWFTGKTIAEAGNVTDKTPTTGGHDVPWYLGKANKALATTAPLAEQEAAARAAATKIAPNDPLLPDYAAQRVRTDVSQAETARKYDEGKWIETINDAIMKGVDGKPVHTIDELKFISPEVGQAYDNLSPSKQIQVQKNITAYSNAHTKITNQETAQTLQGLAHGSAEEVDRFLEKNIYQEPLNRADMDRFSKLQRQLQKDRGGSVEIRQALKMAEPILTAEGVELKDKEVMAKFRGAYIDSIYDWKAANPNKPLDETTAKVLASQAVQKGTSENFWYGKDYMFNLPLPNSIMEKIKAENPNVSKGELDIYRQEFVRQQLQALQKSKAAQAGAAGVEKSNQPGMLERTLGNLKQFRDDNRAAIAAQSGAAEGTLPQ